MLHISPFSNYRYISLIPQLFASFNNIYALCEDLTAVNIKLLLFIGAVVRMLLCYTPSPLQEIIFKTTTAWFQKL